jgi:hypothetical protein
MKMGEPASKLLGGDGGRLEAGSEFGEPTQIRQAPESELSNDKALASTRNPWRSDLCCLPHFIHTSLSPAVALGLGILPVYCN